MRAVILGAVLLLVMAFAVSPFFGMNAAPLLIAALLLVIALVVWRVLLARGADQ